MSDILAIINLIVSSYCVINWSLRFRVHEKLPNTHVNRAAEIVQRERGKILLPNSLHFPIVFKTNETRDFLLLFIATDQRRQ